MIGKAIKKINPNAVFTIRGEEIEWHNDTQPIAKQLILDKVAELQAEEDNRLAQQESKKQSAIAKLQALGLDEEEVKAILGV